MSKLLPIYCIAMILAALSEACSRYRRDEWGEKRYIRKEALFYTIMTIAMAAFVGLRLRGNDTYAYRQMYEMTAGGLHNIRYINWINLSGAPGLQAVCVILKTIGASTQDYLMVMAMFTVSAYLWFIRKYTNQIWLSVYLFLTMGVYGFTMAAIKQTTAVAFLVIAVDRAIQRKMGAFAFWVAVAELFHPYAFIYLVVPFLSFTPWTTKTWFFLAGTAVVSFGLTQFLEGMMEITEMLGFSYGEGTFVGEGVNIFRVLVVWVPTIISFIGREKLRNNNDRISNIFINLSMMCALIMFMGLFGTANSFARLANYFLIFQVISLPWLMRMFNRSDRKLVTSLAVVCYAIYGYYSTAVVYGGFDKRFDFMGISEYLSQLL